MRVARFMLSFLLLALGMGPAGAAPLATVRAVPAGLTSTPKVVLAGPALAAPLSAPALAPAASLVPAAAPSLSPAPALAPADAPRPASLAAETAAARVSDPASAEGALASAFDGASIASWRYERQTGVLETGGEAAPYVAEGNMRVVHAVPGRAGLLAKVYAGKKLPKPLAGLLERLDAREERKLSDAGAAPRLVAAGRTADGMPVHVVERVRGRPLSELMHDPQARELGRLLLAGLAGRRLFVSDLHLKNVMIGTTDSNPVRRAYVVDGFITWRSRWLMRLTDALIPNRAAPLAEEALRR